MTNSSPRVLRNIASSLLTQIASWLVTFLVTYFVPTYLRGTGFGTLSVAGAFSASAGMLVTLGTSTILIKEIARNHRRIYELVLSAIFLRIIFGTIAVLIGQIIARFLHYDSLQNQVILISMCVMIIVQSNDAIGSALQGLEDFPRYNASLLVDKVLGSTLSIMLVYLKAPLIWFSLALGVSSTIAIILNITSLSKHINTIYSPFDNKKLYLLQNCKILIKLGTPLFIASILFAIWEPGNNILLSKLSGNLVVSWYGLAKRIGGTAMFLPAALGSAMLPSLTRFYSEKSKDFDINVRRMFRLMLICAVPFSTILILAPERIIELMHYPKEFYGSVPVMRIMGATVILWYLSQVAVVALLACDRHNEFSRITGTAAIFCLPLCALCIMATNRLFFYEGVGNGAIGSMVADVIIEICMLTAYLRLLPRGTLAWREFLVLGRATVAALPLVFLLHAMHSRYDWYLILPGLALYPILCVVLRCVDARDMDILKGGLARKFTRSAT